MKSPKATNHCTSFGDRSVTFLIFQFQMNLFTQLILPQLLSTSKNTKDTWQLCICRTFPHLKFTPISVKDNSKYEISNEDRVSTSKVMTYIRIYRHLFFKYSTVFYIYIAVVCTEFNDKDNSLTSDVIFAASNQLIKHLYWKQWFAQLTEVQLQNSGN